MKIKTRIFFFLLSLMPLASMGQVEFIEVENLEQMKAAQKKASDQMLMLYVDVYATWCGPCKLMDSEVYSDPYVAAYMNTHYVNVRMDGETDYGRIFVSEQQLEGYPTMFIFSDDGERISKIVGYRPATDLVSSLKSVNEGYGKMKILRARYNNGTIGEEEFADYITVVREMGNQEKAEELTSEYVEKTMDQKGRLSDSDIRVVAFYTDLDDAWWERFSEDRERLKQVLKEDYILAMEKIYNRSLVKAVKEERIDMISRMANELAPLVENEAGSWDLRSLPFIQFYYYTDRIDELVTYVDKRFETDRKGDHRWLFGAASQITSMDQQYRTPELLKKESDWFAACILLEEHFDYYFYQGTVLFFLKESEKAKDAFLRAEKLASTQEQRESVAQVLGYINNQ